MYVKMMDEAKSTWEGNEPTSAPKFKLIICDRTEPFQ